MHHKYAQLVAACLINTDSAFADIARISYTYLLNTTVTKLHLLSYLVTSVCFVYFFLVFHLVYCIFPAVIVVHFLCSLTASDC